MSFFDKIFGGKENQSNQKSFWKTIESEEDLAKAIESSYRNRVAIFKHSTSCFISKTVLRNFEKEIQSLDQDIEVYYLDLLAYRSISNAIADNLNVGHQSPQLLVLEKGKVINHASHQDISITQITQ